MLNIITVQFKEADLAKGRRKRFSRNFSANFDIFLSPD